MESLSPSSLGTRFAAVLARVRGGTIATSQLDLACLVVAERLESTKGPVQVIVVDQAERPSAN